MKKRNERTKRKLTKCHSGAVAFSVAANTPGPRTGILTIGTQSFIVRQAGVATPRVIRVVATSSAPGNIAVPIEIVSQGDENALGFTLTYDPAVLGNPTVALGADAADGQLSTNPNQTAQGRLGIALALAAGQKFAAGTRQFAVVTLTTPPNLASGMTQIDFDDLPSAREVSDVSANALPASYQLGSISIVSGFEADTAPRPQGNGSAPAPTGCRSGVSPPGWTRLRRASNSNAPFIAQTMNNAP